jgi:hypothetical protein
MWTCRGLWVCGHIPLPSRVAEKLPQPACAQKVAWKRWVLCASSCEYMLWCKLSSPLNLELKWLRLRCGQCSRSPYSDSIALSNMASLCVVGLTSDMPTPYALGITCFAYFWLLHRLRSTLNCLAATASTLLQSVGAGTKACVATICLYVGGASKHLQMVACSRCWLLQSLQHHAASGTCRDGRGVFVSWHIV